MATFVWIASALLSIHAANSYILLTANLDDVHNIVRQLKDSPLADQFSKIWRRASGQFSQDLAKIEKSQSQFRNLDVDSQQQFRNSDVSGIRDQRRVGEDQDTVQEKETITESPQTTGPPPIPAEHQEPKISDALADDANFNFDAQQSRRKNQETDDFVELGKNASLYLKSLRRMFEKPHEVQLQ